MLNTSAEVEASTQDDAAVQDFLLGVLALATAYSLSGLNCVYVEKALKGSNAAEV